MELEYGVYWNGKEQARFRNLENAVMFAASIKAFSYVDITSTKTGEILFSFDDGAIISCGSIKCVYHEN